MTRRKPTASTKERAIIVLRPAVGILNVLCAKGVEAIALPQCEGFGMGSRGVGGGFVDYR